MHVYGHVSKLTPVHTPSFNIVSVLVRFRCMNRFRIGVAIPPWTGPESATNCTHGEPVHGFEPVQTPPRKILGRKNRIPPSSRSVIIIKQYSKDSLLQVEKPKGDHPLLVQAWDAHKKQQEYAEQCICTDYGTAQYCSGTPECFESVKATALLAFGLSIGAHAYKDGGAQGAGVFGDKKFHDALHKITVKVQGTVRDHRQQKSLLQTNNIPELCARLAVMQYENMADYICHINCNGYKGAHEISAGCDIPLGAVEINVELHITGCTIHVRNKWCTYNSLIHLIADGDS